MQTNATSQEQTLGNDDVALKHRAHRHTNNECMRSQAGALLVLLFPRTGRCPVPQDQPPSSSPGSPSPVFGVEEAAGGGGGASGGPAVEAAITLEKAGSTVLPVEAGWVPSCVRLASGSVKSTLEAPRFNNFEVSLARTLAFCANRACRASPYNYLGDGSQTKPEQPNHYANA